MKLEQVLLFFCVYFYNTVHVSGTHNRRSNTFDTELYESVLDTELCKRQVDQVKNNALLMTKFLDASFRIPKALFKFSTADFGSYHECLAIREETVEDAIQGKYCFLRVAVNQDTTVSSNHATTEDLTDLIVDGIISRPKYLNIKRNIDRSFKNSPLNALTYSLAVCVPKSCTTEEWINNMMFNVSIFGFQYNEQFCRLPNDKPIAVADYISIVIFSVIGLLTILSTGYDLYYTYHAKASNAANVNLKLFSVYTNGRALITFKKSPNALQCLDGIRVIMMMWVIIGHTYSTFNFIQNNTDFLAWISSFDSVWVTTGFYTVDTFLFMTGLLLVYTTVGKMNRITLIKNLHSFYLNRIFRLLPLMATTVLLQTSVLHHIGDGPYWVSVGSLTESCRNNWWSTILNVQNYVHPNSGCLSHSWYIAIDIQLYIISPLVLFWMLSGSRASSWAALIISNLIILVAATVFNFMLNMPSSIISRPNEIQYYMKNYYMNTLTRGAPFFIGLIYGYILNMWKGKNIKLNKIAVCIGWLLSCIVLVYCAYLSSRIMHADWDSQTGDNLYNSFARVGWAMGMGWIILACVKGYGGPVNWFFSLQMWKVPARLSYAMYLCHYPIQFVITGLRLTPMYFTVWDRFFEFLAILMLSFIVGYVMMVTIDAPCSLLFKLLLQGNGDTRKPAPTSPTNDTTAKKENA